ncbi:MAG: Thermophilic metalloprotease (M29) [Methanomassiliicoccales archaeon PtaU1.Bin124]|nr:MAG: Thermophilic metalloprotease (M29) [Methanomassiliicoccales archaeon PtaU1.Bin124]
MPGDDKFKEAVKLALTDVLGVKEGERVLIITNLDGDPFEICQEIFRQAEKLKACPVLVVQQDKDNFKNADQVVLEAIRTEPDIIIAINRGRLGKDPYGQQIGYIGRDGKKYHHIWDKIMDGDKRCRAFWSPNVTMDMWVRTVPIDYEELRRHARKIKAVIDEGERIRVMSPGGTDVTFGIKGRSGQYDDGDFRKPGQGGNLPTGEVYVSPANGTTEGVIVFDGSVDLDTYSEMPDEPVRVVYRNGYVAEITGGTTAKKLQDLLDHSAAEAREKGMKDEERNTRHLGELGIGLNPNARMSCNILEDEKIMGTVHFAIGMNLDHDAHALIHLDNLVLKPTVYVDDVLIMKDGRHML